MANNSVSESDVSVIVKSLNVLEDDLDSLNSKVGDMKKQLAIKTQSQIESMTAQTRQMATKEAEVIIDQSKKEADAKSKKIQSDGDAKLTEIKSTVDANFDSAVKNVVLTILKS